MFKHLFDWKAHSDLVNYPRLSLDLLVGPELVLEAQVVDARVLEYVKLGVRVRGGGVLVEGVVRVALALAARPTCSP